MRSILTMLGIVIGIASVIILMSIGRSAQDIILNQVQGIGSNLIIVIPGAPANGKFAPPASSQGIIITSLVQRDIDTLKREPSISGAAGEVRGQAEVVYGNNSATVGYQGVTSDFFSIRNLDVKVGQRLSAGDISSGNHIVVLGPELAETLFGTTVSPVNKTVRLKDVSFRVVGVLSKGGSGPFGVDQGNLVIMPISVAQKQLLGITYFNDIIVEGDAAYDVDFVKARITSVLRQNHGITNPNKDDFDIRTQEDVLSLLGNITSVLTLFLAAIASISLIVGGIGIMNIMLVAVTERTREIGLRKAVGATNGDILQQFLIESVLLTFAGGIIGIALGAGVVGLAYFVLTTFFPSIGWVFAFPLSSVVLGLAVSGIAGIAFGLYPARQAARKNPIDALRYE
ncbi:MAG: ABC transporter, membrane protein [Parcubacteria group bacterium GW2011_GWB1_57_6]|nr:MAG: ABC transporter, membrane protein [Parcubacteria group bacterium GW2011_GWA1_56_13]KKW46401.1 MAG: ABC transporter, membrane protein [Parcubacteria group bacterium GW2011_GWB1_57_6]